MRKNSVTLDYQRSLASRAPPKTQPTSAFLNRDEDNSSKGMIKSQIPITANDPVIDFSEESKRFSGRAQ